MHKIVKTVGRRGASIEMKFVMRVRIAGETSETGRAVGKQIVNFVMKDAMPAANIAAKQVAASIAVTTIVVTTIAVIT